MIQRGIPGPVTPCGIKVPAFGEGRGHVHPPFYRQTQGRGHEIPNGVQGGGVPGMKVPAVIHTHPCLLHGEEVKVAVREAVQPGECQGRPWVPTTHPLPTARTNGVVVHPVPPPKGLGHEIQGAAGACGGREGRAAGVLGMGIPSSTRWAPLPTPPCQEYWGSGQCHGSE